MTGILLASREGNGHRLAVIVYATVRTLFTETIQAVNLESGGICRVSV